MTSQELGGALRGMDGRPYGNYKSLTGSVVSFTDEGGGFSFTLTFDRIQSDPFAAPTRAHLNISAENARFHCEFFSSPIRRVAAADFLTRQFWNRCHDAGGDRGNPAGGRGGYGGEKGGAITIDRPGQHVVQRSSVQVTETGSIEARFTLSMPARGRSIQGHKAADILLRLLPSAVRQAFCAARYSRESLGAFQHHVNCVEDQETLRRMVVESNLVAFIRNGAVLPRQSGTSDLPMDALKAVPFESPPNLCRTFQLPHSGEVQGMAIPCGVTLVCGGGFHGKSTLLQALQTGAYNRIPGDGREFVCVNETAVKIRAEDGRSVRQVNISPFINNLPGGASCTDFTSPDASGSTSQAANIVEALEAGSRALLIDEDTAATNFMIRDRRMQQLVRADPITPFLHKVRSLSAAGVSSILVVGGCGDYFNVADLVICMSSYKPSDQTARAREIAGISSPDESLGNFGTLSNRALAHRCLSTNGKVVARRLDCLQFDSSDIDLGCVEQLVEVSQVRAIANILQYLDRSGKCNGATSIGEVLDEIEATIRDDSLQAIAQFSHAGDLALPRRHEIAAALNRLRTLRVAQVRNVSL